MKTITLQIGNTDNKLTQQEWSKFVSDVKSLLWGYSQPPWGALIHFQGSPPSHKPYQNFCAVFQAPDETAGRIRASVKQTREKYRQDSAAWTEGETIFI